MKFLPVTCVKFISNSSQILSASGNEVNLLDYNQNTVVDALSINKLKVIHGIELKNDIVIVYGGFVFSICVLIDNKISFTNIFQRHHDFILACMIYFQEENEIKFCISLTHGSTHFYSFRTGVNQLEKLGEVGTLDKSLLYCCHLFHNPAATGVSSNLFLAGGNVQNMITIWQVSIPSGIDCKHASVLCKLAGHKGAIFDIHVNWSDGLLVSMGDDRSVIVWIAEGGLDKHENTLTAVNWVRSSILIGHEARVWGGISLSGDDAVLAWGEDCTVRFWARDGTSRGYIQPHTGRSIWAGDVIIRNGKYLIVTGGNDGAVVVSEYARNLDNQQVTTSFRFDCNYKDFARRLIMLQTGQILVVTDLGKFYLIRDDGDQCQMDKVTCDIFEDLIKHYCFMFANNAHHVVLLGNAFGQLFVMRLEFVTGGPHNLITLEVFELGQKIMTIGPAIDSNALISLNNGQLMLIAKQSGNQYNISELVEVIGGGWAACWTQWRIQQGQQQVLHLVCGDRDGWLHAFELTDDSDSHLTLIACNKRRLSEKSSITSLFWHEKHQRIYVGTKCGDVWSLDGCGLDKDVVVLRNPDMLGWVCRIEELSGEDGLVITGFKSILFRQVAVHGSGQHPVVLMEHPCGGGHREWDYSVWSGSARLAFIQAQAVNLVTWHNQCVQPMVIKPHLHGKEINYCSFIDRVEAEGNIMLLTGSEDCSLAMITMDTNCALQSVQRIHGHISSVRCVSELGDGLMVSAGGRGQVIFWQRGPRDYSFRAVASALLPKLINVDTDSRIMDICPVCYDSKQLVAIASSCGSLIFLSLPYGSNRPRFVSLYRLSQSCITNLVFVHSLLIACSTDGKLYWLPFRLHPDHQHKSQQIGQSGLQGLDILSTKPAGSAILVSMGGDDGSVSVAYMEQFGAEWDVTHCCTHPRAHSGSTVSTKWLLGDNGTAKLASLGSDGRLILWQIHISEKGVKLAMIRCISNSVGVTDPHTMAVTRHPLHQSTYLFCVAGMGAHIFEFDLGSDD